MNARRTMRRRHGAILAVACLLLLGAACGGDDAAPQANDAATPESAPGSTADTIGDVTIHSFLGASLSNGTYIIESASSLVVIDTQYLGGDPETFRAAVDALDKPIAKVLITHDHPDHVGGLNTAFADAPVATTTTVAGLVDAGDRDVEVLDNSFTIDGVAYLVEEYLDAEASAQMVITLPDHDAVFTGDLVFNEVHLFLTPDLDNWIAILEDLQSDSPTNVYPGHGPPAGPGVYAETITYLRTARANLASSVTGEEYKAAMIDAYPDWSEQSLIDYFPRELLSRPDASVGNDEVDSAEVSPPDVDPPDELGAFEVGHTSFVAVDADRGDRSIPVDIWYPVDPGTAGAAEPTSLPLAPGIGLDSDVAVEDAPVSDRADQPLVIFSHGYEGINKQSVDLMETLASHGFVVAAPEHVGNSQSAPGDTFDTAAANRVPDVAFLIDTMIAKHRDATDPFAGRLGEERITVVGHSFGAMTAIGTAAGWAGADPDPRVVAIVAISGVIDGDLQQTDRTGPNAGFSSTQLEGIEIPVLLMGGTEDVDVPIANNDLAFEHLTGAPVVHKVSIVGATHNHFAAVCTFGQLLLDLGLTEDRWADVGAADLVEPYRSTCGPAAYPIDEAVRLQNLYTVSFLQRHQVGDERYGWYLTAEAAAEEADIELESRQAG
ncbi:MAG: alpha/beta fold hydrolase [Acidimicrobiales bacterium]